jgi:Cu-Zn family superoxide dismutase
LSTSRPIAVADLQPTQGNTASGTASFVQQGNNLIVETRMKGLTPGVHGFHLHETGDCSAPDASSAGGHFNPTQEAHGDPAARTHHSGDLGNLSADADGNAVSHVTIPMHGLSMKSGAPDSLAGRSLVVHADPDDYTSQPSGNSGKRVACGVVGLH